MDVMQISDIYILLFIRRSFAGEFWLADKGTLGEGIFSNHGVLSADTLHIRLIPEH